MLRNSSTYIYLILFVGLLCYLTFVDKKIPGTKDREDALTQLFKIDHDDVTGLEITNVHGSLVFQKNNNHWEIKSPINTLADSSAVDEVINQIAATQPQRVIPIDSTDKNTEGTLKEWGLSPATDRVVIHTKMKSYELLVGRKMAINDSVYARASGRKNEAVRIIPNSIKELLQKSLTDFRSRNVFDFEIDKATKITAQTSNTGTTPAQESEIELKNDKWMLQKPLVARASGPGVVGLLNKILAEHIVDFVTDDATNLSSYGLTAPSATFSVTIKPNDDLVLQIGSAVPNKPDLVYAQRLKSNSVFTLTKASVDDLLRGVSAVRDLHVLPFNPVQANRLSYELGPKKAQIRREKNIWWVVDSDGEALADPNFAVDTMTKLSQIESTPAVTDSVTDLKPFGLDKPQGKITLKSTEFKSDAGLTLLIGKNVNKMLYVRNSMEPFIYTVPENAFDFLPANNLPFRDARVIDLHFAEVTGLTITVGTLPPVILTRSMGATWTVTNVKDRMIDSVKMESQSSLLCQLQATTWLGPVLPAYELNKPLLTFSIEAGQPHPLVLLIGAALPDGGHAAQIKGYPTAFEISEGDFGILNTSSLALIPKELSGTNTTSTPAQPKPSPAKSK